MKLTKTDIKELYKFTRQHFVYYYDVQTELVDHLANDIEEIWTEKPNLSFQEARDMSFKKFGIFGFMNVIEAKQKQMNKRYINILWRFTKEWFTLPKLIITTGIFSFFYFFLQFQFSEYILLGSFVLLIIIDLIRVLKTKKQNNKKKQEKEKIFLLESMIDTTRNGFTGIVFLNTFNVINLFKKNVSSIEIHWLLLTSLLLTFYVILLYVATYVIPKKAE